MRVKKIVLKEFKRFDNLTINLGENPQKIVALVGPNGCGKSSIFDAFIEYSKRHKTNIGEERPSYYYKSLYDIELEGSELGKYDRNKSVCVVCDKPEQELSKKSFYVRSPYRYTAKLNVESIRQQTDILEDRKRPISMIALDNRLEENYERLLGQIQEQMLIVRTRTYEDIEREFIGKINSILSNIIDIKISDPGNVLKGRGQLFFEKGKSKNFPYENLSSGEKEIVDLIIDLVVKTPEFSDTIFAIDEPELHLNTSIQRKLLIEVEKLLPDNCQLWVATHSIGFLRALQEELKDKSQVLDFSKEDYFNGTKTIEPIKLTRGNWQRIFSTALEDITGLVAPKKVIYCEGRADTVRPAEELGLDAIIYNTIFEEEFNDSLFVSAGGTDMPANLSVTLQILSKTLAELEIIILNDGDKTADTSYEHVSIARSEIENYLFDKEVLTSFCHAAGKSLDEDAYGKLVTDISNQDLKPVQQQIKNLCGFKGSVKEFKLELAKYILQSMNVYQELKQAIFG